MLDLESRQDILGITVFRDADNAEQFYHLPGPPKISRDAGGPMFDLMTYRKGGTAGQTLAGGFLTMTVDVGLGELEPRVLARIQALGGTSLASVPYSKGSVRIIALDQGVGGGGAGPKFIETVLGSGTPALDGDNRTIFSLSLTELGAAFFLGLLQGDANARPIGVVYDLEYVGLLPAYNVEIDIDISSAYDSVASRTSLGTLFLRADIETVTEQLKKEQHIKIKETARTLELSTPEAMAERQRNLAALVRELCTGVMFQQTLTPGAPLSSGSLISATDPSAGLPRPTNPGTPVTPGTAANPGTPPSSRTTPPPVVTPPPPPPPPPPGGTTTPPAGGVMPPPPGGTTPRPAGGTTPPPAGGTTPPPAGGMTPPPAGGTTPPPAGGTTPPPAGGTTPPPMPGGTTPPPPGGVVPRPGGTTPPSPGGTTTPPPPAGGTTTPPPAGGSGGTVQETWEKLGRPQVAFALKSISQEERRKITYKLDQVSAQKRSAAPQGFLQMMCPPEELRQRIHVIDLDHPFFKRLPIHIDAASVDFAAQGVSQLTVEVRYGSRPDGTTPKDIGSAILRTKDDVVDLEFFLDKALALSYEYRLIVNYQADFGVGVRETRVEGPWTRSELRSLSVHPGWLGVMIPVRLQLAQNTPDDVKAVEVAVRYLRADRGIDDGEIVTLTGSERTKTVNLRLATAGDPVTFTPTVFYADGASEVLPPQVLPGPQAADALAVGVPTAGRVNGDVVLVDALGELSKVIVDIQVLQHDGMIENKSIELTGGGSRQTWSVRLPDRDAQAVVRWRQREFFTDGGAGEPTEWIEAASPNLVAGIASEGVLTVNARWVGQPPSVSGLVGVVVELSYVDPGGDPDFAQHEELFFDDTPTTQVQDWKVRLKDRNARSYSYRVRGLPVAGSEIADPVTSSESDLLLIRPPVAG